MGHKKNHRFSDRHDYDDRARTDWHFDVEERSTRSRSSVSGRALLTFLILISLCLSFLAGQSTVERNSLSAVHEKDQASYNELATLTKPEGLRVVGLVFYGRRKYVDILDCYLRKNLVANNGWLDEVHFIAHTRDKTDLAWLDQLVESDNLGQQGYKVFKIESKSPDWNFKNVWQHYATEPDTVYIKMDDDLIFIDDEAIPRMVTTLLAHPEASSVQANVVNNKGTSWYHYHSGDGMTVQPFLPANSSITKAIPSPNDWRTSSLPLFTDLEILSYAGTNWTAYTPSLDDVTDNSQTWVRLPATARNLQQTPITLALPPDTPSNDLGFMPMVPWPLAAQELYSLLHHLEHGTLSRYHFGDSSGLWNPWYKHYSINFMAIRGSMVQREPFWDWALTWGDEWVLTEKLPQYTHMPVLVETRALAAHWAFHMWQNQERWLLKTDLLGRFRGFANERVCGVGNQKVAFVD